jgi:ligand-binding SRPBCC domain-containing protein
VPTIQLVTRIKSTLEICFDLSRSIDLHKISTAGTNEVAIAGVTAGLINFHEFVTWQATHFGVRQKLTSMITIFNRPFHFRDEMIEGTFKSIIHDHHFQLENNFVIMEDVFHFESPFGIFGKLFNKFILTKYLSKLLTERNKIIKTFAENGKWKSFMNSSDI